LEIGDELMVLLMSAMLGCVFYLIPGYIGYPTRDNEIKVFFHLLEPSPVTINKRPCVYLVHNRDCGTIYESTTSNRIETAFTTGAKVRYNFQPRLGNVYKDNDAEEWTCVAPEQEAEPNLSQESGTEGPPPLMSPQQAREHASRQPPPLAGSLQLAASMSGMDSHLPRKSIPDILKQVNNGLYPIMFPIVPLHVPYSDAVFEDLYEKFSIMMDPEFPMHLIHSDGSTGPWPSSVKFFEQNQAAFANFNQHPDPRFSAVWIDNLLISILKREIVYIRLMQHLANLLTRARQEKDLLTKVPNITDAISPLLRVLYPMLNRTARNVASFQPPLLTREKIYSPGEIAIAQGIRQLFDSLFLSVDPIRTFHLIYKAIATCGEIDLFDNNEVVRKMQSAFASLQTRAAAASSLFSKGELTGIPSIDMLVVKVTLTDRTDDESYSAIVTYFRMVQTHSVTTSTLLNKLDQGLFPGNSRQSN
jgi:hypothetical protein